MKYWVYMNGEVPGSYAPSELVALPGFGNTTLVCPAEGEILEKNWRRSGEFDDLIKAMADRDAKLPPPDRRADPAAGADVDQLLDQTGARLFSHVSSLMKELEGRREERALTQSLQRELVSLKEQLLEARGQAAALHDKLARVAELEESSRRDAQAIERLESSLKAREEAMNEQRMQAERTRMELETLKRRLGEALNDLAIRNRLVDKLSRELTEKELSLAKSLGMIRRLEEDLNRLDPVSDVEGSAPRQAEAPAPAAPPALRPEPVGEAAPPPFPVPAPAAVEPGEAPKEEPTVASAPVDPLTASVMPADPEKPAAQNALVEKFKKLISRYDH